MKRRNFGQYCGLARALELVGERWALLVLRDLTVRPQRFTDLLEGLPGIPTNVLSTRLKELEEAGIVERRVAPAPQRGVVYALTAIGVDLEPAIAALGRWGVSQLGEPRPGEIVTPSTVAMSLRAVFDAQAAAGVSATWEIHAGDIVVHAAVADAQLTTGIGPAPADPDLVITFQPEDLPSYPALMQAARCGLVTLEGPRELLDTFLRVFPSASRAAAVATPAS